MPVLSILPYRPAGRSVNHAVSPASGGRLFLSRNILGIDIGNEHDRAPFVAAAAGTFSIGSARLQEKRKERMLHESPLLSRQPAIFPQLPRKVKMMMPDEPGHVGPQFGAADAGHDGGNLVGASVGMSVSSPSPPDERCRRRLADVVEEDPPKDPRIGIAIHCCKGKHGMGKSIPLGVIFLRLGNVTQCGHLGEEEVKASLPPPSFQQSLAVPRPHCATSLCC